MQRTPDEIKKGMECCSQGNCNDCPYLPLYNSFRCKIERTKDAIALIQQLEFQNGELLKTVEMLKAEIEEYEEAADKCCFESQCNAELNRLEALCKRLKDENEQLQAERDAAVRDMTEIVQNSGDPYCEYCKNWKPGTCPPYCRTHSEGFRWRGVQKEK